MTLVSSQRDIPIIIRPALKRACCEGDACRAAIYSQLLYAISRKVKAGEEYWYGTQKDIWIILDCSWGLSKVIKELDNLVEQGYLAQRRNPKKGYDQTRQYLFGKKEAQKFRVACKVAGVCVHQMGFSEDILHLLKITNGFIETNDCICQIQRMQSLDLTIPSVESNGAIPKKTTKITPQSSPKRNDDVHPEKANTSPSKKDLIAEWYSRFDAWFRALPGNSQQYETERSTKNDQAIDRLIAGAMPVENVKFIFDKIAKDAFWKQHLSIPKVVEKYPVWIGEFRPTPPDDTEHPHSISGKNEQEADAAIERLQQRHAMKAGRTKP